MVTEPAPIRFHGQDPRKPTCRIISDDMTVTEHLDRNFSQTTYRVRSGTSVCSVCVLLILGYTAAAAPLDPDCNQQELRKCLDGRAC
jgi:hypothetical protein